MGNMKKRIAVIGAVSVLAVGGGIAWAAWDSDGSGTASATAGTASGLTVAASPAPEITGGLLSPNVAARGISLTVGNPNNYAVKITKIKITSISVSPTSSTCLGTADTSTGAGTTGIQVAGGGFEYAIPAADQPTVAAGSAGALISVPGVVTMNTSSDNDCQGKSFGLGFTVTGSSVAS